MEQAQAITIFEALASAVRLDVYRLLVRQGPGGLVAGEIAATLGVPPTNLSFHLKALTQSGLVTAQQEGRFQRYRAAMPVMQAVIDYLTQACCAGQPQLCWEPGALPPHAAPSTTI